MILSEQETAFLSHMMRWGSDGYPIRKVGRKWIWDQFHGVNGAPICYATKRECSAAIERYIDMLIDRKAGRLP